MPIKRLMLWQPNEGSTLNYHILDKLLEAAEGLGFTDKEKWTVLYIFYLPNVPESHDGRLMLAGMWFSEHPYSYYVTSKIGKIVVEVDHSFHLIMKRLQSHRPRVALSIKGFQYQNKNFKIKVGGASYTEADKLTGIFSEVEYLPVSSIGKSKLVVEEFLQTWEIAVAERFSPGKFLHLNSNFADYGLGDIYTPRHTAVQYRSVLQELSYLFGPCPPGSSEWSSLRPPTQLGVTPNGQTGASSSTKPRVSSHTKPGTRARSSTKPGASSHTKPRVTLSNPSKLSAPNSHQQLVSSSFKLPRPSSYQHPAPSASQLPGPNSDKKPAPSASGAFGLTGPSSYQKLAPITCRLPGPNSPSTFGLPGPSSYQKPAPTAFRLPGPNSDQKPAPSTSISGLPGPNSYQKPAPSTSGLPGPNSYQKPAQSTSGLPGPSSYQKLVPSTSGLPGPNSYQKPAPSRSRLSGPSLYQKLAPTAFRLLGPSSYQGPAPSASRLSGQSSYRQTGLLRPPDPTLRGPAGSSSSAQKSANEDM